MLHNHGYARRTSVRWQRTVILLVLRTTQTGNFIKPPVWGYSHIQQRGAGHAEGEAQHGAAAGDRAARQTVHGDTGGFLQSERGRHRVSSTATHQGFWCGDRVQESFSPDRRPT